MNRMTLGNEVLTNKRLKLKSRCLRKIDQMDKSENNSQEAEVAKALIKLAGVNDD